jgi:hypothetical protein
MITWAGPKGSGAAARCEASGVLRRAASKEITRPETIGATPIARRPTTHSAAAAAITAKIGKQSTHKRPMITTPSKAKWALCGLSDMNELLKTPFAGRQ